MASRRRLSRLIIIPRSESPMPTTLTQSAVMALIRAYRPTFRNSQDKIAFALHACFIAAGYVLNATGPPAFADDALTASYSDEASIDGWNFYEEYYGFVYSNPEKDSKKVVVRCLLMNNLLQVFTLRDGSSGPFRHRINIRDFVEENGEINYSSQFKDLGSFLRGINNEILSRLASTETSSCEGRRIWMI